MPAIEQRRTIEVGARGFDEGKGIGREANSANRHKDTAHLQGVKITDMSIETNPNKPEDFEEEKPESEDIEWVMDDTPDIAYLSAMCEAYGIADAINVTTKREATIQKRIKRKALAVIDKVVDSIYNDFFDTDTDDSDSD